MDDNLQQVPRTIPQNRYQIILFTVLCIFIVPGSYFVGKYSNKTAITEQNKLPMEDQEVSQNERPIYKQSKPVLSPNNDIAFQLVSLEKGEQYSLNLFINIFSNPHKPVTFLDGNQVDNSMLADITGKREKLERIFGYFQNYVTWSPKDNRFAILLPDKVVVYEYTAEQLINDTYSPPRIKISLAKSDEFAISSDYDPYDYPVLLFSGNGNELFYSSKHGVKMLIPEEKIINTQPGYYPSNIYPIPDSSGIAYWINKEDKPDNNSHYFVTDFISNFKEYKLNSNFSIDYPKEIILSPNLLKVCIGWESSGSQGKISFDLNTGKQIEISTGCMRWINNNEVVVYQSDSPGGGATGNISYYLVNLLNGNKTFLHSYYSNK